MTTVTGHDARTFLLAAGPLLFGHDWQRPLARALGPLHPDGARDAIDDRLVRRWVAGERDLPGWVKGALQALARSAIDDLRDRASELQAIAEGRMP